MDEQTQAGKTPKDTSEAVQSLTPRQREVLALIGQGLSTAEIARRLYRTVKTVESHRLMLGKRLGARNRVELARIAIQAGLTDLPATELGDAHIDASREAGEAVCRALEIIDGGSSGAHGRAFFEGVVARVVGAFDAAAAFIIRVGADGTAKTVAGSQGDEIRYTLSQAEDADLSPGEVRLLETAPTLMLAEAKPSIRDAVSGAVLTPLHDSRGQRLGTFSLLLKAAPEEGGCIREIVGLLGGRIAAELECKESEDRFNYLQTLVSSAADRIGLWERNLGNGRVTWSSETYRILGFEPDSVQPTRERFMAMVHPDDRGRVLAVSDEVVRRREPAVIEYRVTRADGLERRIQACYEAAPDATGRPGWIFGTLKDVTSRG